MTRTQITAQDKPYVGMELTTQRLSDGLIHFFDRNTNREVALPHYTILHDNIELCSALVAYLTYEDVPRGVLRQKLLNVESSASQPFDIPENGDFTIHTLPR